MQQSRNCRATLKRRALWNLEDIVVKLKKSKAGGISLDKIITEKGIERKHTNDLKKTHPRVIQGNYQDPFNVDEENLFEEKSSFVSLLEQKDEMNTYNITHGRDYLDESKQSENDLAMKPKKVSWQQNSQLNSLLIPRKNKINYYFQKSILYDKIPETKCEKCNKRFFRRSQLIRHLANHVVHKCTKCGTLFHCVRKYKRHMSSHESWPCEFCSQVFYDASEWYKHRATHTMVSCGSCDAVYYSKTALYKHKAEHMYFICPSCKNDYGTINQWSNHRMFQGKPCGSCIYSPIIACKVCRESFLTQDNFLNHECQFQQKFLYKRKQSVLSKADISELIGVDTTKV